MYKVKTSQYETLLEAHFRTKVPMYVYGAPGIGKSAIPRQKFPLIAKDMGRKYIEWGQASLDEKKEMINDPTKYFVFCDQRVANMDPTDLRGIPNMVDTTMLQYIPLAWIVYFTTPGAAGVIFFDEMNLAPPVVTGAAYSIIHERTISDRAIQPDVFLFGAGNRLVDQANVFDMPLPLRDRFNEFEVTIDPEHWMKWASENNINSHLLAFVQWRDDYLYKVCKESDQKSSTPRGIERASKMIGNLSILDKSIHTLVSVAVGDAFASEFEAYCKYFKSLDWDVIYSKPASIKDFKKESDKLWAVIGGMTEQVAKFKKDAKAVEKKHVEHFHKIIDVVNEMEKDFAIVTLKMLRGANDKLFDTALPTHKKFADLAGQYLKYMK